MILEWRRKFPIEGLQLQWRGSNLFEGDWVERVIGTLTGMEQVEQKITVISGPSGLALPPRLASMQFVIDGGGQPITAGQNVDLPDVPFNCEIIGWTLTADIAGSAEVVICRSTFEQYPEFDEISGTERPTLVSALKSQDSNITTWNTEINVGDVLKARIENATNINRLHIGLRVREN